MRRRTVERAEIIEAARRCFVERGVREATVEDVACDSGVSRATVYRTVGGRSDLIRAVMLDEGIELFRNVGLAMGAATSAAGLVAAGVSAALATIRERPALRRFAGPDLAEVLPVLTLGAAPVIEGSVNLLVPILASARDRGVVDADADLRHAAEEMIRYVLGLLHTPSAAADLAAPEVGAERAARLFGPLLAVRPAPASLVGQGPLTTSRDPDLARSWSAAHNET